MAEIEKMAQEEHIFGVGSKKNKQKKVPQRGLGVAQLEKIISEQQKKNQFLATNGVCSSSHNPDDDDGDGDHNITEYTPFLALNHPIFRQSVCQIIKENSQGGGGGGHENWALKSSDGGEFSHNLGGGEEMTTCRDPIGSEARVRLAYELSTPILPQRSHQFQRPSCSSLVKSSSGISSVVTNQMELPSIQILHCKSYTAEDKMIGMKRPYPLSPVTPPCSSLQCNLHPTHAISFTKSDEFALLKEPRNKFIRESYSNSSPKELTTNNLMLDGDFLSLAPPQLNSVDHSRHDQEYGEKQMHRSRSSGSSEDSFRFFPIMLPTYQTTGDVSSGGGENGETIDLSLKL